MSLDRKVKRPDKEKQLIEKLGEDKYQWAYNIQTKPLPSWIEAFDYAYNLGLSRGNLVKVHDEIFKNEHISIEDQKFLRKVTK